MRSSSPDKLQKSKHSLTVLYGTGHCSKRLTWISPTESFNGTTKCVLLFPFYKYELKHRKVKRITQFLNSENYPRSCNSEAED